MRSARKLFLVAAMAIAALAMTAGPASAQVEVLEEGNEHCPAVVVESAHVVHGGCHFEFESTGEVPFFAFVPGVGTVQLFNCEFHLEARIGEDGAGYITQAVMTSHPAPSFPCTRTPCDEAAPSHEEFLWPIQINEVSGQESIEVTFCLRPVTGSEGESNTPCEVHLPDADLGNHDYELGAAGSTQYHCEVAPGIDVWIENAHFVYEEGSDEEKIEIVH